MTGKRLQTQGFAHNRLGNVAAVASVSGDGCILKMEKEFHRRMRTKAISISLNLTCQEDSEGSSVTVAAIAYDDKGNMKKIHEGGRVIRELEYNCRNQPISSYTTTTTSGHWAGTETEIISKILKYCYISLTATACLRGVFGVSHSVRVFRHPNSCILSQPLDGTR